MPTTPEVRYVAVVKIERVTSTPAQTYRQTGTSDVPASRKVESFRVPAVRAADLDRLREKLGQYMDLVTDEDFGDEPKVMRGRDED